MMASGKTMVFVVLLSLCLAANLYGQTEVEAFDVPASTISVVVVNDPKSPLSFFGPVQTIGYPNGGLEFRYALKNDSDARIESYEIEQLNWFGSRGYAQSGEVNRVFPFEPRTIYSLLGEPKATSPFDLAMANKAGFTHASNRLWILMVVKVTLSDGSVYDVSHRYKKLSDHIMKLGPDDEIDGAALNNREAQIRGQISSLMSLRTP
jgi:hypothetical protein